MKEDVEVDEPVAAAAGRRQVLPRVPVGPPATTDKQNAVAVQCYKCGDPNHFARDCRQLGGKSRRALPEIQLSVPATRACHIEVLFTNPSARAGYDTRSIFKRSLTGFEFRVFLLLD